MFFFLSSLCIFSIEGFSHDVLIDGVVGFFIMLYATGMDGIHQRLNASVAISLVGTFLQRTKLIDDPIVSEFSYVIDNLLTSTFALVAFFLLECIFEFYLWLRLCKFFTQIRNL